MTYSLYGLEKKSYNLLGEFMPERNSLYKLLKYSHV